MSLRKYPRAVDDDGEVYDDRATVPYQRGPSTRVDGKALRAQLIRQGLLVPAAGREDAPPTRGGESDR